VGEREAGEARGEGGAWAGKDRVRGARAGKDWVGGSSTGALCTGFTLVYLEVKFVAFLCSCCFLLRRSPLPCPFDNI
jgi:hypothetical protein